MVHAGNTVMILSSSGKKNTTQLVSVHTVCTAAVHNAPFRWHMEKKWSKIDMVPFEDGKVLGSGVGLAVWNTVLVTSSIDLKCSVSVWSMPKCGSGGDCMLAHVSTMSSPLKTSVF